MGATLAGEDVHLDLIQGGPRLLSYDGAAVPLSIFSSLPVLSSFLVLPHQPLICSLSL